MNHPENGWCCWRDPHTDTRCDELPMFIVYSEAEGLDLYYHACRDHLPDFILAGTNWVYRILDPPTPTTVRRVR